MKDPVKEDILNRYNEIKAEIKAIFEANFHITGWDVPEVDDQEAKSFLLEVMQQAFDEVKKEILNNQD